MKFQTHLRKSVWGLVKKEFWEKIIWNNTMAKRNLIAEIHSVKSRSYHNSRYDYMFRLNKIDGAIEDLERSNDRFKNEFYKFIPISMVACIEAFFKSTVRDLVDDLDLFFSSKIYLNPKNRDEAFLRTLSKSLLMLSPQTLFHSKNLKGGFSIKSFSKFALGNQ